METAESDREALDVRVLGALEVYAGDRRLEIAGRRARGLVALLAHSAGRVVTTAAIVRQVWGWDEAEAGRAGVRNTVQARVSSLRRVLGTAVLRTVPGGYLLDLPGQAVDSARFEAALSEARGLCLSAQMDKATEAYRRALGQWQGELAYADVRHVPTLVKEGDRLGELRLQALRECLTAEVREGAYDTAAADLLLLTRQYPQVEEFWTLRMLALDRQGRPADALAVYHEARRVLDDRFGLTPGARLRDMERIVLRGTAVSGTGQRFPGPAHVSRPPTSFLGRETDLEATLMLLRRTRMLTLTGPGGVGKTRLALEAAQALVDCRAQSVTHGAVVVDLVPHAPGTDLASAVLDAMGAVALPGAGAGSLDRARNPLQVLCDTLRERQMLLVLDNCEHVARDVAELCAALAAAAPTTTILATSRQPLETLDEVVHPVTALTVHPQVDDAAVLAGLPAVRLFLDRALAVRPELTIDAAVLRSAGRICRRLDGIPLAIEMAAARAGALGLAEAERLLDDRFRLLDDGPSTVPERHRTLESAVAWSYHLLDEREQRTLDRLSVFRGPFLAQQACGLWSRLAEDDTDVPTLLEHLTAKSMLDADSPADFPPRFRVLEAVRLYAARRLERAGGTERAVRAHMDVYVSLATARSAGLTGAGQAQALRSLMLEDGNIRAALRRALHRDLGEPAQRLIGALGYVTWMRGGRMPDWELITRAMTLRVEHLETKLRALAWAAVIGSVFGHAREAIGYAERAVNLGRTHHGARTADLALAQVGMGHALHRLGRWAQGDAALREAEHLAARSDDRWTRAAPATARGLGMLARGRIADAEVEFLTAAEQYRACGDNWARQRALLRRAIAREARGDGSGAAALLTEAVALVDDLALPEVSAPAKAALARVTLLAGRVDTGRSMVRELAGSNARPVLDAPDALLAQCKAVLAEMDGRPAEAMRRHLDAGVRLADAGLCAEAVESWGRVVLLAEPDSPQLAAALGAAEQLAATRDDPRVLATVRRMRGLRKGIDPGTAAAEIAEAERLRAEYGLGLPALLLPTPSQET